MRSISFFVLLYHLSSSLSLREVFLFEIRELRSELQESNFIPGCGFRPRHCWVCCIIDLLLLKLISPLAIDRIPLSTSRLIELVVLVVDGITRLLSGPSLPLEAGQDTRSKFQRWSHPPVVHKNPAVQMRLVYPSQNMAGVAEQQSHPAQSPALRVGSGRVFFCIDG